MAKKISLSTRFLPAFIVLILLAALIVALPAFRVDARHDKIWADSLEDVQQKISQLGAYQFTTHLIEIREPAASGRVDTTPSERHLHLEGTTDRDAGSFNLLIWDSAQTTYEPEQALEVKAEGGALFGRYRGGEWEQLNDAAGLQSASDTLIYLDAAHHVSVAEGDDGGQRVQFVIDSDKLSGAMRQQLQDYLYASGDLPAGLTLVQSNYYAGAVATGELWLDVDGLPRRLFVSMEWPEQNGERIIALIQSDFSGFDTDQLIPSFAGNPAGWAFGTAGLVLRRADWSLAVSKLAVFAVVLLAAAGAGPAPSPPCFVRVLCDHDGDTDGVIAGHFHRPGLDD